MALIPGSVRVGGLLAPSDSEDKYAVTSEIYNIGGYRSVSSLAERDAIFPERRKVGMLVYVVADKKTYQLENGIDNASWVVYKTSTFDSFLHNSFSDLQGGSAGSYFHLTESQHTGLFGLQSNSFHFHSSDRDRGNHSGSQLASTISDLDSHVLGISQIADAVTKSHTAVTSKDSDSVAFSITGQEITASVKQGGIKHSEISERGNKTHAEIDTFIASKGQANGLAELDSSAKIPAINLPGFVDDVLEYATLALFPITGSSGIIYVDASANKSYRWTGTIYASLDSGIALGETQSTAYRGDRGAVAYQHSQTAHNKTMVGLGNVQNVDTTTTANIEPSADKNFVTDEQLLNIDTIPDLTMTVSSAYEAAANCLAKDNISPFTPAGDYNPATKKYVDDRSLNGFTTSKTEFPDASGLYYCALKPETIGTKRNISIVPSSTGALLLRVPDGADGGNVAGSRAIDLQMLRYNPSEVASGGMSSILAGQGNTASGNNSSVIGGLRNTASGLSSGVYTSSSSTASGQSSVVLGGHELVAHDSMETVLGVWNEVSTGNETFDQNSHYNANVLFNIGCGTSAAARKSAIKVLRNGDVGIGVTPTANLHISGGTTTKPQVKLNDGQMLTTPVNGSLEYSGGKLYFTGGGSRGQIFPVTGSSSTSKAFIVEYALDLIYDGYSGFDEFVANQYAENTPVIGTMFLILKSPIASEYIKIRKWNGAIWEVIDMEEGMSIEEFYNASLDRHFAYRYIYSAGSLNTIRNGINVNPGYGIQAVESADGLWLSFKTNIGLGLKEYADGCMGLYIDTEIFKLTNAGLFLNNGTAVGQTLVWNGTKWTIAASGGGGSTTSQVVNSIPTGTKNSENKDFVISETGSIVNNSVVVFKRGLRMTPTVDYTFNSTTKTITFVSAPDAADNIICDYSKN